MQSNDQPSRPESRLVELQPRDLIRIRGGLMNSGDSCGWGNCVGWWEAATLSYAWYQTINSIAASYR